MTAAQRLRRPPQLQTQLVLTGALLGAAVFLLLYGFAPLNPLDDSWVRGGYVERDVVQHYTGWLFYRASPLTFPLGMAEKMNIPYGGYIGLSDSIPLFALLFRLLNPVLPATFQYFGLWGLLCSVLQGAASALLLSLYTQNRLRNALCSLLFLAAPIFLDRQLRHSSLGAQWFILLALYLYIKHRRAGTCFSPGFVALCAASITVHPYFTPMVLALLFALLAEHAVAHKQWRQPLLMLGASLAATLAAGFVMGVFSGGSEAGSTPYGYFSMNLNALFNPANLDGDWSLFLPALNQTLGNYDGFNYLGLGVVLALAALAVDALAHLRNWPVASFLKRYLGLLLVCLCLTVFAVSNQITAFGRVLAYIPLPQVLLRLAGVLRSSGRMFYPVWYLLLLAACVYALRRPPIKWKTAAVCALAAVQLLDLSPMLAGKAQSFRPYEALEGPLQSSFWNAAAPRYDHIASLDDENLYSSMDLALYAIDNGMTTDDPFTARYDHSQRQSQMEINRSALTGGSWNERTLYITSVEATFLDYAEALAAEGFYCARIDEHWYVLAPLAEDDANAFTGTGNALEIADYPLRIADYSDASWEGGVYRYDGHMVCFEDSAFARTRLDSHTALVAGGESYTIVEISYRDAGWILVTLDRDAAPLRGKALESVP